MNKEIRCGACDKNFGSTEALEMHNSVKHSIGEDKKSKSKGKSFRSFGFMLLVFALIVFGGNVFLKKQENYDDFNFCLKENGAKMYGAYWCSACLQQKRILGESENIPYVECSLPNNGGQTVECINQNIQSYPTWKFNDSNEIVGIMSIEDLSAKTSCVVQ